MYNDYRKVTIESTKTMYMESTKTIRKVTIASESTFENGFVKCRLDQVALRTKTVKNAITAEFGEEFLFKWAGIRSLCIENMCAFVVIYSRSLLTLQ